MCPGGLSVVSVLDSIVQIIFSPLAQGSANSVPWAKSSSLLVCVNKVVLEHSHAHSFMYCQYFTAVMVELSSCNIEQMARKS